MSTPSHDEVALLRQAVVDIKTLRSRLAAMEAERSEPIAVVGMGCRFPGGGSDPPSFWQLLRHGVDAVREVPAERWDIDEYYDPNPDVPGKMSTRWCATLDAVDGFDAAFFAISPREAEGIDPQQRLLLEVCWEALEDAGHSPRQLQGSPTGVFVGISHSDYMELSLSAGELARIDTYTTTGGGLSVAAGRLSYVFGFEGPCVAVDTACSSSLVAVHLAIRSLRGGECRMAVAGGVNLILSPAVTIALSKLRMMAPDGRSKTFDAAADGFVRGEGCGLVVLKRLADAQADGDRILALLRGSAVNQDGRSSGLTAPNGPSQEAVIRRALADARLEPGAVRYIEAHGTGTELGDPIEIHALASVFRPGRAGEPLSVGSVKTNLGHLESAAGIAGLIKAVLAVRHREIPPHLHFQRLNPHITPGDLKLHVPTAPTPWPAHARPSIAGVSSFGFSGTNAHVVVEEAPAAAPVAEASARALELLCLSAKSADALRELAARHARNLERAPDRRLADVAFTAAVGRSHLTHRAALLAGSPQQARERCAALASGERVTGLYRGECDQAAEPEIAFLFTGQGAQYPGMGRQLYDSQPVFREALERCAELLRPHLERPLLTVLYPENGSEPWLDRTAYTQPALFAFEYALAELWRSWGIVPAAVLGHSVGDYVAACVAGVLPLEAGLKLIAVRGRLMQELPAGGAMAAVFAAETRVREALEPHAERLAIAAVNGPENTVVSGARDAVDAVLGELQGQGIRSRRLNVSHAFHSPLVEPMLEPLAAAAAEIPFRAPRIDWISNPDGGLMGPDTVVDAGYWRRQTRQPVRFAAGIETLLGQGYREFLEIGPQPALLAMARRCAPEDTGHWLPSLRRGREDWQQLLEALGALYARGAEVDWAAFYGGETRQRVRLPTYPFQRRRYWHDWLPAPGTASDSGVPREWIYELEWVPRELPGTDAEARSGRWLILADAGGLGAELARRLEARGHSCTVVRAEEWEETPGGGGREDFQRLCGEVLAGDGAPLRGVVHLRSLDAAAAAELTAAEVEATTTELCCGVLYLVQALVADTRRGEDFDLWLVTRNAVAAGEVAPGDPPPAILRAPLWGMGRVIALEHPELGGGLLDLDPEAGDDEAEVLLRELVAGDGEDQIAYRAGQRRVARLEPGLRRAAAEIELDGETSYWITGGLGGLGLDVARWMVRQGARHLVLSGRRGATARAQSVLDALRRRGAEVAVVCGDVAVEDDVVRMLAQIRSEQPPLRGIVHAAGVAADCLLRDLDAATLKKVFHPKVSGGWLLHQHTRELDLEFFVVFSSGAALWGSQRVAHYGAANHFLDALAHHRRALGLPALSVNWGLVGGVSGMVSQEIGDWLRERGVRALAPAPAMRALAALLGAGVTQAAVADIDARVFLPVLEAQRRRPLLEPLRVAGETVASGAGGELLERLSNALPDRRRELLEQWLARQVREVLGLEAEAALSADQGFFDLGLDSLMAVELRDRLHHALGSAVAISKTVVFDHPHLGALTSHLLREILQQAPATAVPARRAPAAEPIAIVGMGCRFPGGADDPAAYWRMLRAGVDAIGEIPAGRWDVDAYFDPNPEAPGKISTRCGGFLSRIDEFDAAFFGIAPREAVALDPQHRLVLEVCWEALEHGGQAPDQLTGTPTGVFVGLSNNEYGQLVYQSQDPAQINAYTGVGNALNSAAGRVAYVLGLRGPAMVVDTACSSSLVAMHLACQSLRRDECRRALAGGVGLLLTPAPYIYLSRARMLAPDGRSKTFDAAADGYSRGEGCGMVLLKKLSDAEADGDRVLAVIRGSGVNHDGRSAGFTVPNGPSQEALIRSVLAEAEVDPADVGYVEAHGTGTSLGDPIEVQSLQAVFGAGERQAPLVIGSVKTNFGHLEAAAGIAGLIKVVLAVEHGEIPPHLHFRQLNPAISQERLPLEVAVERRPWPATGNGPRIAGVSSFGASGTNAHLLVAAAAAAEPPAPAPDRPCHLLTLSARDQPALRELAARYQRHLAGDPGAALADVCFTANAGRAHFAHRLAVVAESPAQAQAALAAAGAQPDPAVVTGKVAAAGAPKVAFLFPDADSWPLPNCHRLHATQPTFRRALERCDELVRPHLSESLASLLCPAAGAPVLDRPLPAQPAVFALEYALAELWRSWGIAPAAVVGVGVGEYAAACVAGVMAPEEALALLVCRARGLADPAAPGRAELEQVAAGISFSAPRMALVSGCDAQLLQSPESCGASYWRRQLHAPQRLAEALRTLDELGSHRLLAIAPPIPALAAAAGDRGPLLPSLSADGDDWRQLLGTLARLYAEGVAVDWAGFDRDYPRRRLALPTYPFQRRRYWIDTARLRGETEAVTAAGQWHPLLGRRRLSAGREIVFESRIRADAPTFLADHRVLGTAIFPIAAYLEMALSAARQALDGDGVEVIENLTVEQTLALSPERPRTLQLVLTPGEAGRASLTIFSLDDDGSDAGSGATWTVHATAGCRRENAAAAVEEVAPEALRSSCPQAIEVDGFYRRMRELGLHHGPEFQGLEQLWQGEGQAFSRLRQTPAVAAASDAYLLHPALTDACMQALGVAMNENQAIYLPVRVERVRLHRRPAGELWGHAQLRPVASATELRIADLRLLQASGEVVAEFSGFHLRRTDKQQLLRVTQEHADDWLYELAWRSAAQPHAPAPRQPGSWLLLADDRGLADALAAGLRARGEHCALAPATAAAPEELLAAVMSDPERRCRAVAYLGCPPPADAADEPAPEALERDYLNRCTGVLHTVQALVGAGDGPLPQLCLVTRNAQALGSRPAPVAAVQTALWGLGRTISLEHPELRCRRLDLEASPSADEAELLLRELSSDDGEDQVAWRCGQRYVARLVRRRGASAAPPPLASDATYLITGGLGALGLRLARGMIGHGARRLLLVDRSEPGEAAARAVEEMAQAGARVQVVRADVARREDVARILAEGERATAPLRGIVHAAGVLDDGALLRLDRSRFATVMAPKVLGAWHLHSLTRERRLDFFVLFSAAAALFGSPGQGNYAAANAFLDGFAHYRRARGLPALAINWGPWAEAGMAAELARRGGNRWTRQGMGQLTPEEGVELCGRLLAEPTSQVAVLPRIDWATFAAGAGREAKPMPLVAEFRRTRAPERPAPPAAGVGADDFLARLRAAPADERPGLLRQHVGAQAAAVLGLPSDHPPDEHQPLLEMGLDSLMAIDLARALGATTAHNVSPTVLYSHPTIHALAQHLGRDLLGLVADDEPVRREQAPSDELRETVAVLSEGEVEALLEQELATIEELGTGS